MAVTDFRSLKSDLVDRNILSTSYFAEESDYQPVFPGSSRTVTVKISAVQSADLEDAGDEELIERIRVKVSRDATTGIDNPQMGDLLTRSVTYDPDRRPYSFTGHKEEISETHWVLIFQRHFHTARGPRG